MKKTNKLLPAMLAFTLIFALAFTACDNDPNSSSSRDPGTDFSGTWIGIDSTASEGLMHIISGRSGAVYTTATNMRIVNYTISWDGTHFIVGEHPNSSRMSINGNVLTTVHFLGQIQTFNRR